MAHWKPIEVKKALDAKDNVLYATRGHLEYLTTKEMVRLEDRMIEFASRGKGISTPINAEYTIPAGFSE